MDSYEVTRLIFTKIKNLDPENASKIMGYILIQDLAAKDLVRLAYGPDTLLHSLILRAKIQLGLCSNTSSTPSTPSSPSPLNPIARPNSCSNSSNPFSQSSPRIPNGFDVGRNPSSPSSNSWPLSGFPNNPISPKSSPLLSYDNIRTGSFPLPVFSNHHKNGGDGAGSSDTADEHQLNEYLSFLNESSSSSRVEDLVDPRVELGHGGHDWAQSLNNGDAHFHRRSFSASDACFGSEESALGTGYKPCLYFARGFCKNGSNCKFVHGGFADSVDASGAIVGSPSKLDGFEQHEEIMRMKASQQQRLAAASQFMNGGVSPSQYKYVNYLLQQQNDPQRAAAAAAFIMGEEIYKFGRCRPERNDFLSMASAEKANSASRQIYLTFPAESTFKDEDVSEYFNKFGPVQDVRIPYQQKRMFGFVTFVHPETVRFILSKGNPHFICDSRVLVKPYKEKGKVLDKRQQHQQQQQLERGEFSPCMSPSGLDSREPYDLHLGGRMFYNTQEMLLRRKLEEQAELQQAIELQGRRLMNLQLPDLKSDRLHHHQRSLSVGAPAPLPPQSQALNGQDILPFDGIEQEVTEGLLIDAGHNESPSATISITAPVAEQQLQVEGNTASVTKNGTSTGEDEDTNPEDLDLHKSVEHVLPDSLFASPTKSAGDRLSDFSTSAMEAKEGTTFPYESNSALPITSTSYMASQ
ncbi:zinc finger CCCH domain-containing protein 55 isoform X1 [Ziziphus jujuba]|uniref:Zinc finger CCCH domain-containing protein 55 isoform X1 n=1 Tax=Ziziphus jujuba TaxID=326968 RepID=A0ABM3ZU36_ZIZJJ|nr:zinc finger CCCH domain-containing protein 55 isoform X1 [Ziziphus jujuba]XP_060667998.1 zinc finger CCCH domain-containing protein 55 isoform X1 [Ziziphus jujuba]XP_060667999.1 zinc finger CCCH domain-containing protein 55 isoform X1 [Ziziphus jujuba]XP_060668000.1 zinc finger CCCH domain-containing protein 55 isoform X1 [Ziziphus jujuba]XP_060668001.1 zinc finger CCCH domain-containing protein 55 isoform X1 [Ziziphus jujuba]XP_060668002.1 zinc finger CCCH domain-containing protein 55 isof